MVIDCARCPLRQRPIFDDMTKGEITFMQSFKSGELRVAAGTTLLMEGANSPQLYTALSGMGLRYKTMVSGDRQVINFVMPGDFLGLQAGVMQEMQHSVEATSDMVLCVFDRKRLWELFRDQPGRAYDLTWLGAVEEHFLGESLAILGHMSGIARVARALVRLYDRAEAVDLGKDHVMPLPYKQQDMADALGMSLVHTNKMLKKLREKGVATWRSGQLQIHDYTALCILAELEKSEEPMCRPLL
ncbi:MULTISPECIES: Crp/Fnr family transcriptional regulator [unclassified Yoonia]|uniref:Crp/Fnr family transcriptional regulator n=1 Tax=unclassified Yoonia TaxID=2629118 RepID=UPI002AFDD3D7|nr:MULTISPECIES: Crp/Fnr family transcriptional regulator [unclassified Yoonia]